MSYPKRGSIFSHQSASPNQKVFKVFCCKTMFNAITHRRRAIQARPSITNPKQTSICQCNISIIIIIIVIILCSLSLYLSSQILQQNNLEETPIIQDPKIKVLPPSDHLGKTSSNSRHDPNLSIKLKKSLEYLLRDGHMDRVEYMIGFRGTRFTKDSQYGELKPRDINKKYDYYPCTQSTDNLIFNIIILDMTEITWVHHQY